MAERQRFLVDGHHSGLALIAFQPPGGWGTLWLVDDPPPDGHFDPGTTDRRGSTAICVAAGEYIEAQLVDLAEAQSKALACLKGAARG